MSTQSTFPNNGPVTTQNAGTTGTPTLAANATRTFTAPPPAIMELDTVFDETGKELALVGEPIRDASLGVAPHDFDMTTPVCPERIEELLAQWGNATWDIDKEPGTIGGRRGDLVAEVTTYRIDEYEIDSRKPEVTLGDTLEGDLTRHDFTVSTMTMRPSQMAFVNPCGGLVDLVDDNLRTPVSAEQSFDDDPLRIVRTARSPTQLSLDVDMDVMNAMETMISCLKIASAERIRAESERLIISPHPCRGIELMAYMGVAGIVLPEVINPISTVDGYEHHGDVYEHILTVVEQVTDLETGPNGAVPAPDFILRFAVLMHNTGKPATRHFEPDGTVSSHHHKIVGAEMMRKRMKALHSDKATIEAVSDLVTLYLRFYDYGEVARSDSAVYRYVADAGDLLRRLYHLTRTDCTTHNRRKVNYLSATYGDLETCIAALREQKELSTIYPDLDSNRIMEILEPHPSCTVKIARDYLSELRMERGLLSEETARQALLDWWASDDVRALVKEYQAQQVRWEAKVVEKKAHKATMKAAREAQRQ